MTAPNGRVRVLVVEDHADQALVLERWLNIADIEVHVASDGDEGVLLARHGGFDAVLSDLRLPGRSGLEIVRASKAADPSRPAIVMTAHGEVEHAIDALREAADDFLVKPLRREDVVERIRRLIRDRTKARRRAIRKVLAIGAHPDDVEIGVGGVLARHVAEGDQVVIVTCTNGEAGGKPSVRVREARRAAERLGAELVVGTLRDTRVSEGYETIALIEDVIATHGADIVYTHTPNDLHQDHRAVHRATLVAARKVPNVFCYQSPSTTPEFRPTHFVDVSAHMQDKTEALECFASQLDRPYFDTELIRSTARYWGRFTGFGDAEPLETIRSDA